MDPPPRSSAAAAGSGSSAAYTAEIAESLRFEEEIQSLMRDNTLIHPSLDPAPPPPPPPPPPPSSSSAASSFTALLGLSPNQAVELLHDSIGGAAASASPAAAAAADPWPRLGLPLPRASPTFPSNAALVDRAARFSVFAASAAAAAAASAADADSSSPASSSGDPSPRPNHPDPPAAPPPPPPPPPRRPSPAPKRKDPPSSSPADKSKAKAKTKRSSSGGSSRIAEDDTGGLQKLPYVHVRARRGQATDSHSLAERARREKINARMKLLQELVPGCSKISGTALVLDEIINHVQSLQRQVEFLSMRLAAVNPRVDFGGLDSFLSAECGRITGDNGNGNGNGNGKNGAEGEGPRGTWTDGGSDGVRRPHHHHQQQQQQIWHVDLAHPHHAPSVWERGPGDANGPHLFINPSSGVASLYGYDPSSASAPLQSNQLKTEL